MDKNERHDVIPGGHPWGDGRHMFSPLKTIGDGELLKRLDPASITFQVKYDPCNSPFSNSRAVHLLLGESKYTGRIQESKQIGEEMIVTIADVQRVK